MNEMPRPMTGFFVYSFTNNEELDYGVAAQLKNAHLLKCKLRFFL